uniref:Uncharacterized protein n=1 Tax=Physcomitrium patens TaxID=3218 RepID=A0A2K1KPZ5_PHYPA|nr:hypothetical protein PHYPA_006737 [Physcomitrium patens]
MNLYSTKAFSSFQLRMKQTNCKIKLSAAGSTEAPLEERNTIFAWCIVEHGLTFLNPFHVRVCFSVI